MDDTILLEKLIQETQLISTELKYVKINAMEVILDTYSHITASEIKSILMEKAPALVDSSTKVIVVRKPIGEMQAVIKVLDGEKGK